MTRESLTTRLRIAQTEHVCGVARRGMRGIQASVSDSRKILLLSILAKAAGVYNNDELDLISCWINAGAPV